VPIYQTTRCIPANFTLDFHLRENLKSNTAKLFRFQPLDVSLGFISVVRQPTDIKNYIVKNICMHQQQARGQFQECYLQMI
jgi:hypothetical protein